MKWRLKKKLKKRFGYRKYAPIYIQGHNYKVDLDFCAILDKHFRIKKAYWYYYEPQPIVVEDTRKEINIEFTCFTTRDFPVYQMPRVTDIIGRGGSDVKLVPTVIS